MGNKIWDCTSDGKERVAEELVKGKKLPWAIALYLVSRGIGLKDVDAYFDASLEYLSDPFRFPGCFFHGNKIIRL